MLDIANVEVSAGGRVVAERDVGPMLSVALPIGSHHPIARLLDGIEDEQRDLYAVRFMPMRRQRTLLQRGQEVVVNLLISGRLALGAHQYRSRNATRMVSRERSQNRQWSGFQGLNRLPHHGPSSGSMRVRTYRSPSSSSPRMRGSPSVTT